MEHFQNLISLMLQSAYNIPIGHLCSSVDIRGMIFDTLCDFFVSETSKETKKKK
jgi:hypothetical protein